MEGDADFFKKIKIICLSYKFMWMTKGKSITHHADMIVASFSSSDADNHDSLGVDQEEALRHKHRLMMRPCQV